MFVTYLGYRLERKNHRIEVRDAYDAVLKAFGKWDDAVLYIEDQKRRKTNVPKKAKTSSRVA